MIHTALGAILSIAQTATAAANNDPVQTFILWAGGILTTACAAVFNFIRTKLKECEEDRLKLFAKIEEMHAEFLEIKDTVTDLSVRAAVSEREQEIRDEIADREAREEEGRPDSIPRIEHQK
jgi:hypothetical protein